MSLWNPISRQYRALMNAFQDRNYLTLAEAAEVMNIPVREMPKSLRKMEEKELFKEDAPFIDEETGLVIRSKGLLGYVRTAGTLERIIQVIDGYHYQIDRYESRREEQQKVGTAKNVGKAVLRFAGNALGGMSVRDNYSRSTQEYRYQQQQDQARQINIRMVMETLRSQSAALLLQIQKNPPSSYPSELQKGLVSLYKALVQWGSSMLNTAIPSAWNQVERLTTELLQFSIHFPELAALAVQAKAESTPTAEVCKQIRQTKLYLAGVLHGISHPQMRASVEKLLHLLEQLEMAYAQAGEDYNASDARSLKNIYLPMLQSIMEKYVKYENNPGGVSSEKMQKTLGVLEGELPKALNSIREDLLNRHSSSMEDEATALRQKLTMDGLV